MELRSCSLRVPRQGQTMEGAFEFEAPLPQLFNVSALRDIFGLRP